MWKNDVSQPVHLGVLSSTRRSLSIIGNVSRHIVELMDIRKLSNKNLKIN